MLFRSVVIGRAQKSDVWLDDPKRLVSQDHAEIVVADGRYWLRDLASINGTDLNSMPLEASQARELHTGDSIEIGNFTIECTIDRAITGRTDTVFDFEGNNPFDEHVDELGRVLHVIADKYEESTSTRVMNGALNQALARVIAPLNSREAWRVISRFLD